MLSGGVIYGVWRPSGGIQYNELGRATGATTTATFTRDGDNITVTPSTKAAIMVFTA